MATTMTVRWNLAEDGTQTLLPANQSIVIDAAAPPAESENPHLPLATTIVNIPGLAPPAADCIKLEIPVPETTDCVPVPIPALLSKQETKAVEVPLSLPPPLASDCVEVNVGANELPDNDFLDKDILLHLLANTPSDELLYIVPNGIKENVYFLINNEANISRRKSGKRSEFYDDRGAWTSGSTSKTHFLVENGDAKSVVFEDNTYFVRKNKDKQSYLHPLDPQPRPEEVITMHRYYAKHGADPSYQKRVSWLAGDNYKVACHEFKGITPPSMPHGRTTTGNPGAYIRMAPGVMRSIKEGVQQKVKPKSIFDQSLNLDTQGLRNRKQIYNLKSRIRNVDKPKPKAVYRPKKKVHGTAPAVDEESFMEADDDYEEQEFPQTSSCAEMVSIALQATSIPEKKAEGGIDLPHEEFLEHYDIVQLLKITLPENLLRTVPKGAKENVYFLVNNEANADRRRRGRRSKFSDDRGVWVGGATSKTLLLIKNNDCKSVVLRDNIYFFKKTKNRAPYLEPVDPQPHPDEITTMFRHYAKHSVDRSYEKRVTWLGGDCKGSCYEFKGLTPKTALHGHTLTGTPGRQVRRDSGVGKKIQHGMPPQRKKSLCSSSYPDVYDEVETPRNKTNKKSGCIKSQQKVRYQGNKIVLGPGQAFDGEKSEMETEDADAESLSFEENDGEEKASLSPQPVYYLPAQSVDSAIRAEGGTELPHGEFLDMYAIISMLKSTTPEDVLPAVPKGYKENTYFLVNNQANVERRKHGRRSKFYDDSSWISGSTSKSHLLEQKGVDTSKNVVLRNNTFFLKKFKDKQPYLEPLDPQPNPGEVTTLCRHYSKHKANKLYERRISWIDGYDYTASCHEYKFSTPQKTVQSHASIDTPRKEVKWSSNYKSNSDHRAEQRKRSMSVQSDSDDNDDFDGPNNKKLRLSEQFSTKRASHLSRILPLSPDLSCDADSISIADPSLVGLLDATGCSETPEGAHELPNQDFFERDEMIKLLQNTPSEELLSCVPNGRKVNVYFLVKDGENAARRKFGRSSKFRDDVGSWAGGPSMKSYYYIQDGSVSAVLLRDDKYCVKKNKNKKTYLEPLDPQPGPEEVIVLHRYYIKNSLNRLYEKRISWLGGQGSEAVCHEYRLQSPTRYEIETTGNLGLDEGQKTGYSTSTPYRGPSRRKKSLNKNIFNDDFAVSINSHKGEDSENSDEDEGQSKDSAHSSFKTDRDFERSLPLGSGFSDQVSELEGLQRTTPFLQMIIRRHDKTPCVILYSSEQLEDLKRFCCPPDSCVKTVLGVHETFSISSLHVTFTVYENLALLDSTTGEPPVFCGPIFLHGDSDVGTFGLFFSHLASLLADTVAETGKVPVFGTDEEEALRKAIAQSFPRSTLLCCTQQLRKKFEAVRPDKLGLSSQEHSELGHLLFGEDGKLALANDLIEGEEILGTVTENKCIEQYLQKLSPLLLTNLNNSFKEDMSASYLWKNRNFKSYHHILKQVTQWKSLKLVKLVEELEELVNSQFGEARKSFIGEGEFKLHKAFKEFSLNKKRWQARSPSTNASAFAKFLSTPLMM